MNEERATGWILRARPFSETSLILHWLTPALGRIATVAKGARRPKSPWRGKLDLFHELDFTLARSRRSDLHTLREAMLRRTYPMLRQDVHRLQQASYAATLIEQSTEAEAPLPGIAVLFGGFLEHVDRHAPGALPVLAFEIRLLGELGFSPLAAPAPLAAGARQLLRELAAGEWPATDRPPPPAAVTPQLSRFLDSFLLRHLERVPRGRQAALHGEEDG